MNGDVGFSNGTAPELDAAAVLGVGSAILQAIIRLCELIRRVDDAC